PHLDEAHGLWVFARTRVDDRHRRVDRAVVDGDHLVAASELHHDRFDLLEERAKGRFLVEEGDHEADLGGHGTPEHYHKAGEPGTEASLSAQNSLSAQPSLSAQRSREPRPTAEYSKPAASAAGRDH